MNTRVLDPVAIAHVERFYNQRLSPEQRDQLMVDGSTVINPTPNSRIVIRVETLLFPLDFFAAEYEQDQNPWDYL